jgi:hypothetical protein
VKTYVEIKYNMLPDGGLELVSEKSFNYEGPVALCIRQLVNQAEGAANTAGNVGAGLGGQAATEGAQLNPFYAQEMKAEHAYDPTQINEMLTAAGAGVGGAAGAATTEAKRNAATTGNASAGTAALDSIARERMKTGAGVSEGVAANDVTGALGLRQAGAAGESGLYGENIHGQLAAMGQQATDINAATQASQTGWLQQAEGIANTGANIAKACWIAAATYGSWDNPRIPVIREFLFNTWPNKSWIGRLVAKLYLKYGERIAEKVKTSPLLKAVFLNLFERI